jgi:hypothetical protein
MRILVMGPKKIVYPLRNARNFAAEARIFQGTKAQLPRKAARICPLRMLMYRGQKAMRSLAAEMELAAMFMPRVTIIRPIAAKAAAARDPAEGFGVIQREMISTGFQRTFP